MRSNSKGMKIFFTVLSLIVFLISLTFSFLSNAPVGFEDQNSTVNSAPSIFISDIEYLSAKYPNSISPASWAFVIIWPLIFFWNAIAVCYMVASLCLQKDRSPIMREPALMPVSSLIFWSLTFACALGWIFLYDREIVSVSFVILVIGSYCGYISLALSYRNYFPDILLLEEYSSRMLWLVRILIHNGFAVLVTWLTCAWKLNLATLITYVDSRFIDKIPADVRGSLTSEDAGTISISILLLELIVWFILENFVFERYCRYTLTIYPVVIFALSAIFNDHYIVMTDGPIMFPRNQVIVLTGIVMASVAFVARIILVVGRHRKRPRFA